MITWIKKYAVEYVLADVLKPVLDKLPVKGSKTAIGASVLIVVGILELVLQFVPGSVTYVQPLLDVLFDSGLIVTAAGLLGKAGDDVAAKREIKE